MAIKSLARLKVFKIVAKEPIGRSLKSEQVLPALEKGLAGILGPFKTQPFKTFSTQFTTHVLAGKLGMGKKVYALMNELDFTPVRNEITGYYGGFRPEPNRKSTTVNYCSRSGVVVITTNLDVLDV
jgi:hypothetical protein